MSSKSGEFRLERIFQSIKLANISPSIADGFRLERIFQSIKLSQSVMPAHPVFRLERIFQSIKLTGASQSRVKFVPARAHFPID